MSRTEDIIIDAFWQLLEEKPYAKITVKDIVDRCQINRNTFYYHFQNIPELLKNIIKKDADFVIQSYIRFESPLECLAPLVESCVKRKRAILHIYNSMHRETFLKEMNRILLYVVTQYISTATASIAVSPKDKKILIRFYKCMLSGIILDWLDEGMGYDLFTAFTRVCSLFDGASKQAFMKSAEKTI